MIWRMHIHFDAVRLSNLSDHRFQSQAEADAAIRETIKAAVRDIEQAVRLVEAAVSRAHSLPEQECAWGCGGACSD